MAQFHIHPDGIVFVRTAASGTYVDTLANFALDHGAALPVMPCSAVHALYDDGDQVLQYFDTKNNQIGVGQKSTWAFAAAAIAEVSSLLAAQAKRIALRATRARSVPQVATTGKSMGTTTVAS